MSKIKFTPQRDAMDCGPACLTMIARSYGKVYPVDYIRKDCFLTREGVSLLGITEAAQKIGLQCVASVIDIKTLTKKRLPMPCILHWNQNHFVVLDSVINKNVFLLRRKQKYRIADPAHGIITLSENDFLKSWLMGDEKGIALFAQPTDAFFEKKPPKTAKFQMRYMFRYLKSYKLQLFFMFLTLLAGSALTLIFPFLNQILIDRGVNAKDLNLVSIILLAQLFLFFGSITFEIIRNWLMLYVGTKMSIVIISDFLKKMLSLPVIFFETKMQSDFQQRIQDNQRIENFLTSQSLTTFFSLITFSVFFGVLWYYDLRILTIYFSLTILSVLWTVFWLDKRKFLDYFRFQERAANQESIYEMLNGVAEMKLNNFADYKRNRWEDIQKRLFKINIRILRNDHFQLSGFDFINQIKNVIVTFFAATLVIRGNITLGAMMSISYIIGQMNSPVNRLVSFFRSYQDAKLSFDRLNEVQQQPDEESLEKLYISTHKDTKPQQHERDCMPIQQSIIINDLSFQYEGPHSPFVLKKVNLTIPKGKITAIVGSSGSGKTTLMKLILKFYEPTEGRIVLPQNAYLNEEDNAPVQSWRNQCGVVMQDGFIFADTIERNIATGEETINYSRLERAIHIANLNEFVDSLPLKYNTKLGAAGNGISAGQRQRILIARAVYKNPLYIFFDEATSALDAENEKIIHDNLQFFFKGKTVLIIAHRLSTVKNANQIIVLDKGSIIEKGTHLKLVEKKGAYYSLIKNQLELGK